MKTKEFIEKVEEMGYDVNLIEYEILIEKDGHIVVSIGRIAKNMFSTNWRFGIDKNLFDLASEYAKTPIDEREKE